MAANTKISNESAKAMLDALTALANGGVAKIYDGTQPADPDTAVSTQNILAELNLSATAFGAATDGGGKATATANAVTSDSSANNTGTATWFRVFKSDGTTAVWDGSAGEAADNTDMTLDNKSIQAGVEVSISSWTVDMPEA